MSNSRDGHFNEPQYNDDNSNESIRVFIIGHPRCGTTSIYTWMHYARDVVRTNIKELRYFDNNYHQPLQWYEKQFEPHKLQKPIYVDCNPAYSYVNFTAERIHAHYPDAKIVQIVRDPFDLVYSWWKLFYNMREGREPRIFHTFCKDNIRSYFPDRFNFEGNWLPFLDQSGNSYKPFIFESAAFGSTLERYTNLFGLDNVMSISFDSLIKYPATAMNHILEHAGAEFRFQDEVFLRFNIDDRWDEKNKRDLVPDSLKDQYPALRKTVHDHFGDELKNLERIRVLRLQHLRGKIK